MRDSKFMCWSKQCRDFCCSYNDIEGCWSSDWPAACRLLLLLELLQCWAVRANTCWPATANLFNSKWGCVCFFVGNLMCVVYEDLTAEDFKSQVAYTSGNLPCIACDRKVSQESNDCRSCCWKAAVSLDQQQPLANVHDNLLQSTPALSTGPVFHSLRCREFVKEYFIDDKLRHLLPHDGVQATEKVAKQALNLRM